jgi:hypothetical protein
MPRLHLERGILPTTFEVLQACGKSRCECVAYWTGPLDGEGVVDRVEHPAHAAGRNWYEVDHDWLTAFFAQLRQERRTVRAQVHTHPGPAGHSETDDQYSIVPAIGFLSLVLPRFAQGDPSLRGAYLAELQADGTWIQLSAHEVIAQ